MRSPKDILEHLQKHAQIENYQYERLYRNLYNPDFYLQAYQNIYANKGAMTPGIDGMTLDGFGAGRVDKLIASLKDHSYRPTSVKRVYIPKKNGMKRPLGIASSDDKLVQEIVRMLLESIYEPTFSNLSHGFRAKRSCHTALLQIQYNFTGVKWFIEGDIKAYFDTIDHHILVAILRRRIRDEAFLELIWKFLRAGYLEDWQYNATYSGVAQGSGFSPILANIYLNEFDRFMEGYTAEFNRGSERKLSAAYARLQGRHQRCNEKLRKIWDTLSDEQRQSGLQELKQIRHERLSVSSKDPMDKTYRRLQYTRYADDFLIGVIGSHADAEQVKADIRQFLRDSLKLELSDEKTLITHGHDRARFLGYDITVSDDNSATKTVRGTIRVFNGRVKLFVPKDKWAGKLLQYGVLKIINRPGQKEQWKPLQCDAFMFLSPNEMVMRYNERIRGMYNYYRIAHNASVLNKFFYVMQYSLYKTIAGKYSITMTKAKLRYTKDGVFSVPYQTAGGPKTAVLYNKGFARVKIPLYGEVDITPEYSHLYKPKELFRRYKAGRCELCGEPAQSVAVHQVKALASLKGDSDWERLMRKKRRKTLIVCDTCHRRIHGAL